MYIRISPYWIFDLKWRKLCYNFLLIKWMGCWLLSSSIGMSPSWNYAGFNSSSRGLIFLLYLCTTLTCSELNSFSIPKPLSIYYFNIINLLYEVRSMEDRGYNFVKNVDLFFRKIYPLPGGRGVYFQSNRTGQRGTGQRGTGQRGTGQRETGQHRMRYLFLYQVYE